ncbi:MAG: type III pantothenate kinase [Candidatus Bipolaricaulis sp.]|nr:type III pantothenate kinase [Candidatus Bipolaricaulis sp.]
MIDELSLAIDVGNTHVSVGEFRGKTLASAFQLETQRPDAELWREIGDHVPGVALGDVGAVGISSVVRGKGEGLKESFPGTTPVWVLTKDTDWPMTSRYSTRLGTDRMLAAIAARELHGAPVIAVDIGTAGTIDLVDRDGVFAGGVIVAGAGLRGKALHDFTSVLPLVAPTGSPPPVLGLDTEAAILSGLYHGMREEALGLVKAIRAQIHAEAPVVATGSGAALFTHDTPKGWHIERWLNLYGIAVTLRHVQAAPS